jgi:hypothetical protein
VINRNQLNKKFIVCKNIPIVKQSIADITNGIECFVFLPADF